MTPRTPGPPRRVLLLRRRPQRGVLVHGQDLAGLALLQLLLVEHGAGLRRFHLNAQAIGMTGLHNHDFQSQIINRYSLLEYCIQIMIIT